MRKIKFVLVVITILGFVTTGAHAVVGVKNVKYVDGKITAVNLEKGWITVNENLKLAVPSSFPGKEKLQIGLSGRFFYEVKNKVMILKAVRNLTKDKCGGPR